MSYNCKFLEWFPQHEEACKETTNISQTSSWIWMVIKVRISGKVRPVIMWPEQGCPGLRDNIQKEEKMLKTVHCRGKSTVAETMAPAFSKTFSQLFEAAIEVRWDWWWHISRVQSGEKLLPIFQGLHQYWRSTVALESRFQSSSSH